VDATRFWSTVFGNDRPVEVEIGCGTGTFLLQASSENPAHNFFGIEHSRSHAEMVEQRIGARAVSNARVIGADAACVLRELVPAASVVAFHVYFPDPWWKRRHHRRRLFTEPFARDLARALVPGGHVHTATDVEEVCLLIRQTMGAADAFVENDEVRPPAREPTSFERKGLAQGSVIREISFRRT